MGKLTARTALAVVPNLNDVVHLVDVDDTVQDPAGSSYKAQVRQLMNLYRNVTDVGNVDAGEDTLMSYSLPAAALSADKDCITIIAAVNIAASANAKTIKVYFGATLLHTMTQNSAAAETFFIKAKVYRTGAATQKAIAESTSNANVVRQTYTTPAETLSGAVLIKVTGEATVTNEVVQKTMEVNLN